MLFKGCFFFVFCFSIFSAGGHLVQWSKTVLAILVKGHKWNNFVTLF